MIYRKSKEEIELMRQGGRILAQTVWEVLRTVKPGVSELSLDKLAEELIWKKGGEPGFKRVKGYHHTICVSTNDVIVHGIPTEYQFRERDIVGIDCGVFYKGFHTDMAETRRVSTGNGQQLTINHRRSGIPHLRDKKDKVDRFLETGKRALEEAIKVAKAGNRVGNISKAIQDIVERKGGYSVVRALVGHGVGGALHEEPEIPGFLRGPIAKTPPLLPGMVIAIEVIYNMGGSEVIYKNTDGWTISTKDGSLSGVFERTIAITEKDPIVLTS